MWKQKRSGYKRPKRRNYSLIAKLEREDKINEELQVMIGRLTLEEIIGVKLELTAKACGGSIYGLPIWFSIKDIVRDACLKYALSATRTKMEAARFLGITIHLFMYYWNHFQPRSYFDDETKRPEDEYRRY